MRFSHNTIFYYRIVCCHQKLVGNEVPVNVRQLYKILGTERSLEKFYTLPSDGCATLIRLGDILGIGDAPLEITDALRKRYPWDKLIESVKTKGIKIPVILERYFINGRNLYLAIEGRHRISACAAIKPFDADRLIPSILVDRDNVYTDYMSHRKHPEF